MTPESQRTAAARPDSKTEGLPADETAGSYPSGAYSWYVVVVLLAAYTLSFIDRQILALMVDPIRSDLGISDVQLSLLHGFAFAIFYTILGVPLGWLADRTNRKRLIAAGVIVWSLTTAACGLARSFGVLFLARIGVGVGEATLSPSAYSIISDYFPKESRARPLATYSMGVYMGAGLAFIFSGLIIGAVTAMPPISLPYFGEMRPWQITFFAVATPALPVLILVATIREPSRKDVLTSDAGEGAAGPTVQAVSFRATLAYMLARWDVYLSIVAGISILAVISYGYFSWIPSHFIRNFGWTAREIGTAFGGLILAFGTTGMFTGGVIADRMYARGVKEATMTAAFYSAILLLVPAVAAPLVPNPILALVLMAPGLFFLGFHVGLGPSALQQITPNQMRGQVIAIYLFVLNLLALGTGPTIIAAVTQYIFQDDKAVGQSLAISTGVASLLAILVLGIARRRMRAYIE